MILTIILCAVALAVLILSVVRYWFSLLHADMKSRYEPVMNLLTDLQRRHEHTQKMFQYKGNPNPLPESWEGDSDPGYTTPYGQSAVSGMYDAPNRNDTNEQIRRDREKAVRLGQYHESMSTSADPMNGGTHIPVVVE